MQSGVEEQRPNEQHYSKTNYAEIRKTKNRSTKFQKLWSEKDEITLLNGYYEYREKKGKYDASGFYEFIKHRLIRSPVKQHQVSDKICRLKKKYMNRASKLGSKVEEGNLHFTDSHHLNLFELSRKNWATDHKYPSNVTIGEGIGPPSPLSPLLLSPIGAKYGLSNDFISEEFCHFLLSEGVDVDLMDNQRVRNLKRKFGEVELARSKFEYKEARLKRRVEKLKYDHYKRVCSIFFGDS